MSNRIRWAHLACAAVLLLGTGCSAHRDRGERSERPLTAVSVAGPLGSLNVLVGGPSLKGRTAAPSSTPRPVLVLIHGTGRAANDWSAVAADLSRDHSLLIPDLPGHGASQPLAPATTPLPVGVLAASVDAVLAELAPHRRAILIGNSLGGWVALLEALRHPERVERVIGISSSGIYAPLPVSLMPANRDQARALYAAVHGPRVAMLDDAGLDRLITTIASGPAPRVVAGLRAEDFLDSQAGRIETPVDLLWGDADGVLSLAYAERLAGLLPRSRLTTLPGCAHVPQADCVDVLLPALRKVLASPPPEAKP